MDEQKETVQEPEEKSAVTAVTVCDIQFRSGSKIYYFDPAGFDPKPGDHVIIDTSRGPEFGYCTAGKHTVTMREIVLPLRKVLRMATPADEKLHEEIREKESKAYDICLQKIEELGLEMQLVSAEYAFDGSKILFFFTAEGRVDFRELVKVLASCFHTRIELRQIGMRDKAKMVGGFGICGRPFCCAQFLDDFQPVSIKMAKTQNLSLNPAKISGTCGRLMCCLKYEQDAYEDLIRTSPKVESFVDTTEGRGTVVDTNLMAQTVRVRMEQDPGEIRCFHNCDICVLRNGKAKKTDAPIPDDLAPLSGGKTAQQGESYPRFERRRVAEVIEREAAAEQSAPAPAAEPDKPAEAAPQSKPHRSRHRRGQGKPSAPKPEQPATEPPKKPEQKHRLPEQPRRRDGGKKPQQKPAEKPQPKPSEKPQQPSQQEGAAKNRSRNYYRRHHRGGNKPSGGKQE